MSLMTYVGHRVLRTLIRCYFSPASTGQRYLYTGSQDGAVYSKYDSNKTIALVFDIISGDIVQKLCGHTAVVRDASWHPDMPLLLSTSVR